MSMCCWVISPFFVIFAVLDVSLDVNLCINCSFLHLCKQKSYSTDGGREDASARPSKLSWASCDLDLWPPDPQSWSFHVLVAWTTCAHRQQYLFILSVRCQRMVGDRQRLEAFIKRGILSGLVWRTCFITGGISRLSWRRSVSTHFIQTQPCFTLALTRSQRHRTQSQTWSFTSKAWNLAD